mgnify:CR=1 FL=1
MPEFTEDGMNEATSRASDRFLAAFSRLEKLLEKTAGTGGKKGFSADLSRAKEQDPIVRRHVDNLRELADLRNAIVHERTDGHPIAEPHENTVRELERLTELLASPPKVESLLPIDVRNCSPSDRVGTAARLMRDNAFSQLPIVEEGRFYGLLTAEAIALWLADAFSEESEDLDILEEVFVGEILPFRPPESAERFFGRHNVLNDIVSAFEQEQAEGRYLQAVLITQTGKREEKILGILTPADLPLLYRESGMLNS